MLQFDKEVDQDIVELQRLPVVLQVLIEYFQDGVERVDRGDFALGTL